MKKLFIYCAFFLFLAAQVFGQNTGTIKGRLYDDETKQTLPGANIAISGGNVNIGCLTDVDGYYVIKPLSPGRYSIKISYMGYETVIVDNILVNPGEITFMDNIFVSMEGKTLIGVEKKEYIDPLIMIVPVNVLRPNEYKDIAGKRDLTSVIAKMNSDIYSSEQGELFFRGARSDNFVYIVDGVKSIDGKANIPSLAIGSISVYTGGVPANYGDFTGGCIVIETKSFYEK